MTGENRPLMIHWLNSAKYVLLLKNALIKKWVKRLLFSLIVITALAIAFAQIGVRYWLWPKLPQQKQTIEQLLSDKLQLKVSIGKIATGWSGLSPTFAIDDIRFTEGGDSSKNTLLAIPEVIGTIRWSSLWHLQPQFEILSASNLAVQAKRDTQGQWSIAGVIIQPKSGAAVNWLLSNVQVHFKNIKIDILDEFEKTNALQINVADFAANNDGHSHTLLTSLTSDLTQGKLEIKSNFKHAWFSKKNDWRNWQGQFDWSATDLKLANMFHLSKLPARVTSGEINGAGKLLFNTGGKLNGSGTITSSNLDVFWNNNQTSLKLRSLNLDFTQSTEASLQFITAKKLQWSLKSDTPNATPKELNNIRLGVLLPAPGKPIDTIAAGADELNLQEVKVLASQLPIPNKFLKQLNELNPVGKVRNLELFWHYTKPNPNGLHLINHEPEFKVKAQLTDVGWDASTLKIPATKGLSAVIEASEKSGQIEFTSKNIQSALANYLNSEQIQFDELNGTLSWEKNDKHTQIYAKNIRLINQEISLAIDGNYLRSTDAGPTKLDLSLKIPNAKLNRIPQYLPAKLSKKVKNYLANTLVDGDVTNAELLIKGDPKLIPFYDRNSGIFELTIPISNGKYRLLARKENATKDWPAFENVNATIQMKQGDIHINIPNANYQSVAIRKLGVDIDVSKKPSTLAIQGDASGQVSDFLQYAINSPALAKLENQLKPFKSTGEAKLSFKVDHEFASTKPTGYLIKADLGNTAFEFNKNSLGQLSEGQIEFSNDGIVLAKIEGTLFGGPISIQKARDSNKPTDIRGALNIGQLFAFAPNQSQNLIELTKRLSGQINYQGTITQTNGERRTHLDIDLSRINSNLPEPFYKKAGHSLAGSVDFIHQKNNTSSSISWNAKIGSKFNIKGTSANGEFGQVISYDTHYVTPTTKGTTVAFELDTLDADAWRAAFSPSANKKPSTSSNLGISQINTKIKQLKTSGRLINDLSIQANHQNDLWEAAINSPLIAGVLKWKDAGVGLPSGELTARLSRLSIPDEESKSSLTTSLKKSTTKIPKLDITINEFTLGERKLGAVEIKATSAENAWSLDNLTIKHPAATLTAKGSWELPDGSSLGKTSMTIDISAKDSGNLMSALGYPKALENGEGKLTGSVSWEGAPYSFNKKTLNGDLSLEVTRGKLLQVDPGSAKLLGILSFQSLFKLATLNLEGGYGEAFSKGTYFDKIAGEATISNGIARSQNFELTSGLADVLARGRVNLNEETQDLRITITPKLNLGTASVAAYYFINPFIGLSTLVGQYLISTGVNKIYKSDYLIQGSWKTPEVIPLDQNGQPIDPAKLQSIRRKGLLQEPHLNQEKGHPIPLPPNQE